MFKLICLFSLCLVPSLAYAGFGYTPAPKPEISTPLKETAREAQQKTPIVPPPPLTAPMGASTNTSSAKPTISTKPMTAPLPLVTHSTSPIVERDLPESPLPVSATVPSPATNPTKAPAVTPAAAPRTAPAVIPAGTPPLPNTTHKLSLTPVVGKYPVVTAPYVPTTHKLKLTPVVGTKQKQQQRHSKNPPAVDLALAAIQPSATPLQPTYGITLIAGSLREQLERYAKMNGYQLAWKHNSDFVITNNSSFTGSFLESIKQIFTSLHSIGRRDVSVSVFEGNKTIVVEPTRR